MAGKVRVPNTEIASMKEDILYHLALNTKDVNFKEKFGDIKIVILAGSVGRICKYADVIEKKLKNFLKDVQKVNYTSDRYTMFKVGPVLLANHGMGVPSTSIILHEIFKLLQHAECSDVRVFRLGTSGGIGVPPGTVVITSEALNGLLQPEYHKEVLGKLVREPTKVDAEFIKELASYRRDEDDFQVVCGKTVCSNDFYEGQTRRDGATCSFTEEEQVAFLHHLKKIGVVNIEMEAVVFAAMCKQMNVKGAIMCVTIVNRLQEDQITQADQVRMWSDRPLVLLSRYIDDFLQKK